MATKNTTKKTQVKSKAPARTKAKLAAKKPATKSPAKRASKKPVINARANSNEFMTVQPNRETAYWVVLGIVVVIFGLWITNLQSDIQKIYDQIDASVVNEPVQVPVKK